MPSPPLVSWPPRPPSRRRIADPAHHLAGQGGLHNAVIVAENGAIIATRLKRELPNDDVFYEKRYFDPGPLAEPVTIKGVSIGIPICEDIWHQWVCEHLVREGAEILLCPNGSPYWKNKQRTRYEAGPRPRRRRPGAAALSQPGRRPGRTGVMTAPPSAMEPGGRLVFQGKSFATDFIVSDWERRGDGWTCIQGRGQRTDLGRRSPMARLRAGPARLCPQERLQAGRARPVRRHRQRRRRGHGRGCVRRRERPLHHAALSLYLRGQPQGRQGLRRTAGRALRRRVYRRSGRCGAGRTGPDLRQPPGRSGRGKHPVAHARRGADGRLQQARLACC